MARPSGDGNRISDPTYSNRSIASTGTSTVAELTISVVAPPRFYRTIGEKGERVKSPSGDGDRRTGERPLRNRIGSRRRQRRLPARGW